MKFLIIALIVVIVRIIIYYFKGKNKGTTVLGREISAADEKEKQRIEKGNYKESPLPDFDYREWEDEQSLINPTENELDLVITNLCIEFTNDNENERDEIRKSLNQHNIYTLFEYAKRATIFAIRKKEGNYIDNGFTVISMIDSERCDFRDVYVTISFLDYAVRKLNLSIAEFYEIAVQRSHEKTASIIQSCYERSQKNKKIKMPDGYAEIETPYGIRFATNYHEKYNP